MSISLDLIAWLYFPSPILIFSTVSNFLYDENHSWWFDMCSITSESVCYASLDIFKLYFADMASMSASSFLSVYFSLDVVAFQFLHSLIQCPSLVAIMTHAWCNVFFEIFFTLMLIDSKNNVLCSFSFLFLFL